MTRLPLLIESGGLYLIRMRGAASDGLAFDAIDENNTSDGIALSNNHRNRKSNLYITLKPFILKFNTKTGDPHGLSA
jgi:hypothetical protein